MPIQIKVFTDKSLLEFDTGSFDQWCVFHRLNDGSRYAPKDIQYFNRLLKIGKIWTNQKVYQDFVKIYEKTTQKLNNLVLTDITTMSAEYGQQSNEMDVVFTIIYAGMVAEENKTHAILKKRIKRLGLHQLLIEGYPALKAASYSKGKPWKILDAECKKRGF